MHLVAIVDTCALLACLVVRPVARTISDCLGKVQPLMRCAATQELKDQLSLDSEKDNPGPFSRHDIAELRSPPSAPANTASFINPTVR